VLGNFRCFYDVTLRYFGLENNFITAALWIADEGLVKGRGLGGGGGGQLQLHFATCFDFNRKLSSGTINVLLERVLGVRHVEISGG